MKLKIYSRYDTVAKELGVIIVQPNDDTARRYYRDYDNMLKERYGIKINQAEHVIVCLGEYERTGVENMDMSKRFFLDNPIRLYEKVWNINDVPPSEIKKENENV